MHRFIKKLLKNVRSNYQRCSVYKVIHKNFTKFTGKHQRQSFIFNKVFIEKQTLWNRCFLVNFAKYLKTPFFIEYLIGSPYLIMAHFS